MCKSKTGTVHYQTEEIFSIIYMFYHIEDYVIIHIVTH